MTLQTTICSRSSMIWIAHCWLSTAKAIRPFLFHVQMISAKLPGNALNH